MAYRPEESLERAAHGRIVVDDEDKLYYMGHVLMEHRHGLAVDAANGFAEREAALAMLDRLPRRQRRTLAADKAYDVAEFLTDCRERSVTPHVACNDGRAGGSALAARTTRHAGYRWRFWPDLPKRS